MAGFPRQMGCSPQSGSKGFWPSKFFDLKILDFLLRYKQFKLFWLIKIYLCTGTRFSVITKVPEQKHLMPEKLLSLIHIESLRRQSNQ